MHELCLVAKMRTKVAVVHGREREESEPMGQHIVPAEPIIVTRNSEPPKDGPITEELADPNSSGTKDGEVATVSTVGLVAVDSVGPTDQLVVLMEPTDGNHAHQALTIGQDLEPSLDANMQCMEQQSVPMGMLEEEQVDTPQEESIFTEEAEPCTEQNMEEDRSRGDDDARGGRV